MVVLDASCTRRGAGRPRVVRTDEWDTRWSDQTVDALKSKACKLFDIELYRC